jgi:hypothetical protein
MDRLRKATVQNVSNWQEHWSSCAKSIFREHGQRWRDTFHSSVLLGSVRQWAYFRWTPWANLGAHGELILILVGLHANWTLYTSGAPIHGPYRGRMLHARARYNLGRPTYPSIPSAAFFRFYFLKNFSDWKNSSF